MTLRFQVLAIAGLCAAAHGQAQFTPIPYPSGVTPSNIVARAVSADGSTVVGYYTENLMNFPFRWTASTGTVALPASPGSVFTRAVATNADGTIVVGYTGSPSSGCYWDAAGQLFVLPDPPALGGADFELVDVSDDGLIFLGKDVLSDFPAFLWTAAGGYVEIPGTEADSGLSGARNLSGDGFTVIGRTDDSVLGAQAYYWNAQEGIVPLGVLPDGSTYSTATGVSFDGSTIVGFSTNSPFNTGFRWTAESGLVSLGFLEEPLGFGSFASDVNADGRITVGRCWIAGVGMRTTYFTDQLGLVSMRDLLEATGANGLTGWDLGSVASIAADGRTVAGTGNAPNGMTQTWVANFAPLEVLGSTYCDPAEINSTGTDGRIELSGSSYLAMNDLELQATQLPPNVFGYFLIGTATDFLPMAGGSQGNICVGGAIGRFNRPEFNELQFSGSAGSFTLRANTSNVPTPMGPGALMAGDTRTFQAWYRDSNPFQTSNLTTAVEATFQ